MVIKIMGILLCTSLGLCGYGFAEDFPLGYPFLGWGELSERSGNFEQGFKADFYAEQGIDWTKIGSLIFNSFVGIRGTVADHREYYWNNKIGPWAGIKVKLPWESKGGTWSFVNLGVRWENYRYFSGPSPIQNENSVALFLQWGFGGDWKKKKKEE